MSFEYRSPELQDYNLRGILTAPTSYTLWSLLLTGGDTATNIGDTPYWTSIKTSSNLDHFDKISKSGDGGGSGGSFDTKEKASISQTFHLLPRQ
jgi:hypothetical protein